MNEIAKALWDNSIGNIQKAEDVEDVNSAIVYTNMAEIYLAQARFAMEYPSLVLGLDELPYGAERNVNGVAIPGPNSPVPAGPTEGPRVWGAPTS